LRASARTQLLKLGEVLLRAGYGAHFDHRLALDGDCITVVRLKEQRLLREADGLSVQLLALCNLGGAITRIDSERGLQGLVGFDEPPGGKMGLTLLKQRFRARQDLIVRTLADS
jgi:hypothetical protein